MRIVCRGLHMFPYLVGQTNELLCFVVFFVCLIFYGKLLTFLWSHCCPITYFVWFCPGIFYSSLPVLFFCLIISDRARTQAEQERLNISFKIQSAPLNSNKNTWRFSLEFGRDFGEVLSVSVSREKVRIWRSHKWEEYELGRADSTALIIGPYRAPYGYCANNNFTPASVDHWS